MNPHDATPRDPGQTAENPTAAQNSGSPGPGGKLDPATVAELYDCHAESLRAFLIGLLRNREVADDVLQTVFAQTLAAGHTARDETRRGWLFRVAYHEAMLRKRRQAVEARSLQQLALQSPSRNDPAGREAEYVAEEAAIRRESAAQVRAALDQLPAVQRDVVWRRIYHGQTFKAIADELQIPVGTVLTRMRLGLGRLARLLKPPDMH